MGKFVYNQQEIALLVDAFEFAAVGMAIVSLDGHWLKVNHSLCRMFGYTDDEILTSNLLPINYPGDSVNGNGFAQTGPSYSTQVEKCYIRKNGQKFWVLCNTALIRNKSNSPVFFMIQMQDITEQKQAEEHQQPDEVKLRNLLKDLPWGSMLLNEEGMVLHANRMACDIFKLTSEQFSGISIGTYPLIFFREDGTYIPPEQHPVAVTLCTGEPVCDQIMGFSLRSTEQTRWLLVNAHHIEGWLIHKNKQVMVSIVDITQRKENEDLLRKSERLSAIAELGAGVAHEIRNPLTTIKGFIQLLQATSSATPEYLEIMLGELERIEVIISEFAVLARPHAVVFIRKNLQTVLQDSFSFVRRLAAQHNVQITTKIPISAPDIYCEEHQLKQAFVNIMKNAIEAMIDGGTLFVEVVRPDSGNVLMRFIDHGCGISAEVVCRVGEPFFTTKEHGTGLGLMVSQKVIQDHGGTLELKSRPGRGTTIEITLPVYRAESKLKDKHL